VNGLCVRAAGGEDIVRPRRLIERAGADGADGAGPRPHGCEPPGPQGGDAI